MRRRSNNSIPDLSWDGRSVWWQQPYGGGTPGGDSNRWMCAQDLGTEIWSQFNQLEERDGQHEVEPVRIENCSPRLQEILIDCLPFNQSQEDLLGVVSDFVHLLSQEFMSKGRILFEVRGGWDHSTDPPTLEKAALVTIPSDSVKRIGPWVFQVVPPNTENGENGKKISQIIRLDRSRLVEFVPPYRWRKSLASIRTGLPIIGRSEHKWMMGIARQKVSEDFKTVKLVYTIQRARLTAPIGWNARGLFRDNISEFHWVMRELQWKRFCIEVRDSILTKVGQVFALIGSWRGEYPRLVWDHLPTVQQVVDGEKNLMGNGARFDEVLKPFK